MKKLTDYQILFLSLGLAVFFIYFVPQEFNRLLFLIFLYFAYRSDKDYIWIAFIFIIEESPGYLFATGERGETFRVPIYTIIPKFSFSFQQLFVLTLFVKAIRKKIKFKPDKFILINLRILFLYFIFLAILGMAYEPSYDVGRYLYWIVVNLTLFYTVYILFQKEEDYINFFRMLIPFGFLVFGLQIYSIVYKEPLVKSLNPFTEQYSGVYEKEEIRPIECPHLQAVVFFFSMYFMLLKKQYFKRSLLIILNAVSYFSIIITASRSWVIMFTIFYLLCMMLITIKVGKVLLRYGIFAFIIVSFLLSADLFVEQLQSSMKRISTIELIYQGDITGGGTIQRYDIRAPAVMEAFWNESTVIFGTGFSTLYLQKADGHVGFHNLLFNTGIIGAILFSAFFISIIVKTFQVNASLHFLNPYKNVLRIFPLILISMLFVNSGTQFFGYDMSLPRAMIIIFILYFLNNQIRCAQDWEYEQKLLNNI